MEKIRTSIGILTYNSEENLERCLESVKDFSDIVAADGGSTDGTVSLLERYGARVISQSKPGNPITDFALERNRLLAQAREKWFFYLDSDEIMSPELKEYIRTVSTKESAELDAYRVRYLKTNAEGTRPYRTYREYYQVRLFRTDIGAQFVRPIHERISLSRSARVGQTEDPWYVPLDADDLSFSVFAKKAWKRTEGTARSWEPKGLQSVFHIVLFEPAKLIAQSLLKIVLVRLRWGREAIPVKYELLRILYSAMLAVQTARQVFRKIRIWVQGL
jgi:glycosyltransferase involved in cell wall biosynthesis